MLSSKDVPECPVELFLRAATGGDIDGEQELLEVDVAVVVGVESSAAEIIKLFLHEFGAIS